ncbi:hypothetical protein [Comamonas kerstersii]|uniref:hypothetical protein n=1 Tax=Comamonas kerstersii TaxID=225992 RepID=UPI001B339262|nr:hypothetical protein [Comamonas kerstersii]QTW17804.1 hypothetical protein H8N02_11175 [Comamonas kerstersii]
MSVLVKANSTRAQAFKRGFWKGLGAPVVLFGTFDVELTESKDFQPKPLPARKRGSIASDWRAVGQSIDEACKVG